MREVVVRATRAGMAGFLACVAVFGVGGCDGGSRRADAKPSASARTRAATPAFETGGACQLLDYEAIQQSLGTVFSVAAAAKQGETFTCVVQQRGVTLPDLTLSVTGTSADEKAFQAVMVPSGGAAVTGLGKVAYGVPTAAAVAVGPGYEVGWLAGNRRLMVLRMRLTTTASAAEATAMAPKLVELAKSIDFTSS
jgi:hypothetical protein